MRNITYLLGAGASYHSLPIVDSMNERIGMFLHLLDSNNQTSNISLYKEYSKPIHSVFRELMDQAVQHKTIDTYAKKLWLTNRVEDLRKLKVLLDLYFTFEQDVNRSMYKDRSIFDDKPQNGLWSKIGKVVDYRYDVFFATLLDKSLILPENINIISWNYDNQIEIAYNEYLGGEDNYRITENLGIYPTEFKNLKDNSRIIKLNGQATFYDALLNSDKSDLATKLDFLLRNPIDEYQTSISFGWENDKNQAERIQRASKIMKSTNDLIVIGYSFPSFNRSVDAKLFSNLYEIKNIKVQCLPDHYDSIASSIADMPMWESNQHFRQVVSLYNDLDQFYVPSFQLMRE